MGHGNFHGAKKNFGQREITGLICLAGISLFICFLLYQHFSKEPPAQTVLLLGEQATTSTPIEVPLYQPDNLNVTALDDALATRASVFSQFPQIVDRYSPAQVVFAKINQEAPWRGQRGFSLYGSPSGGILEHEPAKLFEGFSAASLILNNPLLLFHIYTFQRSPYNSEFKWRRDIEELYPADSKNSPKGFRLRPTKIIWKTTSRTVEIHYSLLEFIAFQNTMLREPLPEFPFEFGMTSINARDLGFEYLAPNKQLSNNIRFERASDTQKVMRNVALFGFTKKCGVSNKGCNSFYGAPYFMRRLNVEEVPARLAVKLWYESPSSIEQAADLTVFAYFR